MTAELSQDSRMKMVATLSDARYAEDSGWSVTAKGMIRHFLDGQAFFPVKLKLRRWELILTIFIAEI